jgi:hypothetical protein
MWRDLVRVDRQIERVAEAILDAPEIERLVTASNPMRVRFDSCSDATRGLSDLFGGFLLIAPKRRRMRPASKIVGAFSFSLREPPSRFPACL